MAELKEKWRLDISVFFKRTADWIEFNDISEKVESTREQLGRVLSCANIKTRFFASEKQMPKQISPVSKNLIWGRWGEGENRNNAAPQKGRPVSCGAGYKKTL